MRWWLLICIWSQNHCGYHFIQGQEPFQLSQIAIIPFQENEPVGLSPELTHALSIELGRHGVHITRDRDRAEAILTGTILSTVIRINPVSRLKARIRAYQIQIQLSIELVRADGEKLWESQIKVIEDYLPSNTDADVQIVESEANRRKALTRAAQRTAREIHQQMMLASLD